MKVEPKFKNRPTRPIGFCYITPKDHLPFLADVSGVIKSLHLVVPVNSEQDQLLNIVVGLSYHAKLLPCKPQILWSVGLKRLVLSPLDVVSVIEKLVFHIPVVKPELAPASKTLLREILQSLCIVF